MARDASERKIMALVRVGRAMASTADYEQALATLIATISELLDVETAGFMLYDADRGELVLQQPAFGISDPEVVAAYHVPLSGGGNAVQVFLSRRPYLSNDAPHDPRLITRYVRLFRARNTITVPLVVEDEAIGVCHAINKRGGDLTTADMELLSLVAPLLAVSVRSAAMFRDGRERRRQLERAVFLQRELSRTAFDAPGMASLAVRLSDLVGRPVMVLDPGMHRLAAARWPDDLAPDPSWLHEGSGFGVRRRREGPRGLPAVAPIAVGSHFGGYLAVCDAEAPMDEIDARAIEHAAMVFALEMLRERTSYEVESRLKGDLLRELFSGGQHDEREAQRLLRDLGSSVAGPWRVALLGAAWRHAKPVGPAAWRDEVQGPHLALYAAVQREVRALVGVATVAPWRDRFLLLLPAARDDPERDADLAAELLSRVREAAERIRRGTTVQLALSSAVSAAAELSQGLEEAERGLGVAWTLGIGDRPLVFEHLGVSLLLLGGSRPRDRAAFVDEALGPLEHYDAQHGTELVATLRGYIVADYNAAEAARRLYVHPNTLAYRLRRIRTLLGGDPCKGDLRLQVELALKLRDLADLSAAAPIA